MTTEINSESVALVTGGSRGIGRAISQRLGMDGFVVFVNFSRDVASAQQTVDSIVSLGGRAHAVQADISDEAQVQRLFETINSRSGHLDVLVNNAGRTYEGLLAFTKVEAFAELLKSNLLSVHMCTQAAIRMMLPRKHGCIVNISSAASLRSPIGLGAYASTKAALNVLTQGFAREVADRGIRINAIAPGYVETSMLSTMKEKVKSEELSRIPLHRIATPAEIAGAVASVIRDDFSYLVGQIIVLDGGRGT